MSFALFCARPSPTPVLSLSPLQPFTSPTSFAPAAPLVYALRLSWTANPQVLEDNGLDTNRSSKMSQEEFLQLLALFNAAGIHFA